MAVADLTGPKRNDLKSELALHLRLQEAQVVLVSQNTTIKAAMRW